MRLIFEFFDEFLRTSRPREIRTSAPQGHVVLFFDGAEEDETGVSCGAVLIDSEAGIACGRYFSVAVKGEAVRQWKAAGSKQAIHQAEILPVALSLGV